MNNNNDIYISARIFLRMLGGDPEKVEAKLRERWAAPNPLAAFIPARQMADEDVYNAVLADIDRRYIATFSRAEAEAVVKALGELGELRPCPSVPDIRYNDATFAAAWNAAHPDEPKVKRFGAGIDPLP